MKKQYSRAPCVRVLVCCLLAAMLLSLSVFPAGAETSGGSLKVFEEQSILTDLTGATVGDKPFSLENYPYRPGSKAEDMQLLTLFEYGYCDCDSKDDRYDDYALFLYVYNPGNISVPKSDLRHAATLSVGAEDAYSKYRIRLLSSAGDSTHNQLLLKFKVEISAKDLRQLVGSGERTYKLSEFEIYSGGSNAKATKGGEFTYTGYMSGYGDTVLKADVKDMETLSLDLKHCVWRTDNSPLGTAYKTQLDSVYFAIPNDVFEEYGNKIAKIKYHAYKYDTGYVAVFRDDENGNKAYNLYKDYEGKQISNDVREIPTLCDHRDFQFNTTFCYNNRYNNILDTWFVDDSENWAYKLSYVLKMPAATKPESIIETDLQVRLSDDWSAYNAGQAQLFFLDDKTSHEVIREIGDEPWTIDAKGAPNWFQQLLLSGAYQSKPDDLENIQPIRIVNAADFSNFENELYVDEYYKDDLLSAYNTAVKNDESLVLFHFDTSDYFTIEVECNSYLSDGSEVCVYGDPGFVAKETVYMDFDVIDITFEKDGEYTVLPCVSNPIHVIADLETAKDDSKSGKIPVWAWVIIAILVLVIVILLLPILTPILKPLLQAIVWLIALPFKLLWWLLKAVGKGVGALFRKIGEAISSHKK